MSSQLPSPAPTPYYLQPPRIAADAFVAPGPTVVGDVTIESQASLWFGCVARGDVQRIVIGARVHFDFCRALCRAGRPLSVGITGHLLKGRCAMPAIRITERASDIDVLKLQLADEAPPKAHSGEIVVAIKSAGINPSDVKATLGMMPHAVWPRTPGRDYAGIVVDGPSAWIGREVWGSGGELGIRRDGTHASFLVVDAATAREKPALLSLLEAGAIGVPFITAFEGLRRAGVPQRGDTVLVLGANGKVGQAAIQLATQLGARVFGVERNRETYIGHASAPVEMIDASHEEVVDLVKQRTDGRGVDIVYNTVGSPYFEAANRALAVRGRHILIATIERTVAFDILAFYRAQHTFVGIDTLALDSLDCAQILDALKPGFESGALKAFPVREEQIFPLDRVVDGYKAVLSGVRDRVVVRP